MVMAMCPVCNGTIENGKEHKSPYPFNVIMTDEDRKKMIKETIKDNYEAIEKLTA
jgi:hypothetical protein